MDLEKLSPYRQKVLERIAQYEKEGKFDQDVEDDPPFTELKPNQVDYLRKKLSSKIKAKIALRMGTKFFNKMIKQGALVIDDVKGMENLESAKHGAIITCNHFSIADNYVLDYTIKKHLPKRRFYKVIREGNYTGFKGLFGFLFRNANTLPLSSNRRTMIDFMSAVQTILTRGDCILIYPEQGMWWNYRKPRPFKIGGFKMATKANVPVLPTFITMEDDKEKLDGDGYPLQRYTLHILPAVYPDSDLGEKERAQKMLDDTFALYKEKYEEVYRVPLVYAEGEN